MVVTNKLVIINFNIIIDTDVANSLDMTKVIDCMDIYNYNNYNLEDFMDIIKAFNNFNIVMGLNLDNIVVINRVILEVVVNNMLIIVVDNKLPA